MVSCIDFSVSRELPSSSVSEPDSGRTTAVLASPKNITTSVNQGYWLQYIQSNLFNLLWGESQVPGTVIQLSCTRTLFQST